uniref:Uncharacterized protein n=1 Tax=Glossina palpalis gambiensis TaxID=67801 RepID=A0A1B0BCE3_9MUSC
MSLEVLLKISFIVSGKCNQTMSDLFGETQRRNVHSNNAFNKLKNYINDETLSINSNSKSNSNSNSNSLSNLSKSETHNNSIDCNNYHNDVNDGDACDFNNILSLKLRKPTSWKWELSTSKSCSNIALPRILLYDHKGKLLVDAHGDHDEQIYKENEMILAETKTGHTSLTHSIYKSLESEFNGLHIQEATPSPDRQHLSSNSTRSHHSRKSLSVDTRDGRRSSSLKEVRFTVITEEENPIKESHMPLLLSKSPNSTTPTSTSSGVREKRRYRRSSSSCNSSNANSVSILERFSYQKGRFSSPEFGEEAEQTNCYNPRYFLSTSKAGTLVVQEDSFRYHPLRRRRNLQKNSSSENMIKPDGIRNAIPNNEKHIQVNNRTNNERNMQRQRSIGNILQHLSTSDEDQEKNHNNNNNNNNNTKKRHPRRHSVENPRFKELHR